MTFVSATSIGLVRIACLAIVVMVVVTVVDVVGRTLFGASLVGTYDIVQLALVVTVYAGMAEAFRQGAHIVVDLIDRAVGERLGRLLSICALVSSLLVLLLLTWLSAGETFNAWTFGDTTADLGIPKVVHLAGITLGLAAACVTLCGLLVDAVGGRRPVDEALVAGSSIES